MHTLLHALMPEEGTECPVTLYFFEAGSFLERYANIFLASLEASTHQ